MGFSEGEQYLIDKDKVLAKLIIQNGPIELKTRDNYFVALARSIISQQISVKAAASIYDRFKNKTLLLPENVMNLTEEESKLVGLSARKRLYLTDLASHFVKDKNVYNHLENLTDQEVVDELIKVKGIGVWTAQMFLLFTLNRKDIFAPKDRGLQLAVIKNYQLDKDITEYELADFSKKWSPHRSMASLHLWASLKNT